MTCTLWDLCATIVYYAYYDYYVRYLFTEIHNET
jgi:hypothetical protein